MKKPMPYPEDDWDKLKASHKALLASAKASRDYQRLLAGDGDLDLIRMLDKAIAQAEEKL